ncbi:MAG: class I SAM-dependent methyltransferase [Acidimicrobiales bacterium]|jgi:SAM-dependent methyltransferase
MARAHYLLGNEQSEAGQRFDALGTLFNPSTFRHMVSIGLSRGWRVWEVGAGGASVPTWIAGQTGNHVLATDIDTTWLEAAEDGFAVKRHDIGSEPAPDHGFDLVHARLVLVHVPQRSQALATMIDALKAGGWLLVEEADPGLQPLACPDAHGAAQELANKLKLAFRALMAERGADLSFGRQLPRLLRAAGLVDVQSDAYFPMGGPVVDRLERATVEQIREHLIAARLATEDEIEQHLSNIATGRLDLVTSPMVSAWGRKPA